MKDEETGTQETQDANIDTTASEGGSGVSPDLIGEIDGAIDDTVQQIEADRQEREAGERTDTDLGKDDLPPDEVQSGDESGGGKPPDGEGDEQGKKTGDAIEPPAVSDELVERAVKAGMSIADARSFQTADALGRVCGMLEQRDDDGGNGGEGDDGAGDADAVDPLSAIPDLDPNDYDENVVAGFRAMKALIRSQQEALDGMRGDGEARNVDWFDGQVAALGKEYSTVLGDGKRAALDSSSPEAVKRSELKSKVDILEAGYKAAGQDVTRESVFKEAVAIVLGDSKAAAESAALTNRLGRRSRQHVNRPVTVGKKPAADAFAEVASEIDNKFFAS